MKTIYRIFGTYNLAVAVVLGLYIAVGHWFQTPDSTLSTSSIR